MSVSLPLCHDQPLSPANKTNESGVKRRETGPLLGRFPPTYTSLFCALEKKEACVKIEMDLKSEIATVGQLQVYLLLKKADLLAYYDKRKFFGTKSAGLSVYLSLNFLSLGK